MSRSQTSDVLQNNTLLSTSEKSSKPDDSNIRQAGLRFFDVSLNEERTHKPNCNPTLESGTVLTSPSP